MLVFLAYGRLKTHPVRFESVCLRLLQCEVYGFAWILSTGKAVGAVWGLQNMFKLWLFKSQKNNHQIYSSWVLR